MYLNMESDQTEVMDFFNIYIIYMVTRKEQFSISSLHWEQDGWSIRLDNIKSDIYILGKEFKINGFNLLPKCRKKKKKRSRRYSGGEIIYISKEHMKGVNHLKDATMSEMKLLLKMDRYFIELSDDINIIMCILYSSIFIYTFWKWLKSAWSWVKQTI